MGQQVPNKQFKWIGKVGLAALSTIFTFLAVVLVLKIYAKGLGIQDPDFRYENQIEMWQTDPIVGFVNKPNFDAYCFGTVHVTTNDQGFRGSQSVLQQKTSGTSRIIGLGDSVMWGTSVNQDLSFLGLLQQKLAARSQAVEVINAGVVGYSTIQEALFFEDRLVALQPDVVLINFCENDLSPSEDPFQTMRDVYANYMVDAVDDPNLQWSERERELAHEYIQSLKPIGPPRTATQSTVAEKLRIVTKLCLDAPIRRMIQQANQQQIRLIFLLIPPRDASSQYQALSQELKTLLEELQVEYLDLESSLQESASSTADTESSSPGFWDIVQETWLPDLRDVRLVHHFESLHQSQNYIDFVHPSKRGNEIIAEQISQYLLSTVDSKEAGSSGKMSRAR